MRDARPAVDRVDHLEDPPRTLLGLVGLERSRRCPRRRRGRCLNLERLGLREARVGVVAYDLEPVFWLASMKVVGGTLDDASDS